MNKIANEFPQDPEWVKVVEWSPEDGCYVGRIEGPLGECCRGDARERAEIENEWRTLLGLPAAVRASIAESVHADVGAGAAALEWSEIDPSILANGA